MRHWVLRATAVHVDLDVRRRGGEIPERQRAVAVEQIGDPVGVGDDAGDVRGRGERSDPQWTVTVADEFGLEAGGVDVPVGVLRDHDHVGDGLAPRQFVGVVLERADEDHGSLVGRDLLGEAVRVVELRGKADAQDPDHLVDRAGRPRAGEDHDRLVVAADGVPDDGAGVLAQPGGLQPGAGRLRVGVGVTRQDLVPDEFLDEVEPSTRRGVVGVGDPSGPERPPHHLVVADHRLPDAAQERTVGWLGVGHGSLCGTRPARRTAVGVGVVRTTCPGSRATSHIVSVGRACPPRNLLAGPSQDGSGAPGRGEEIFEQTRPHRGGMSRRCRGSNVVAKRPADPATACGPAGRDVPLVRRRSPCSPRRLAQRADHVARLSLQRPGRHE